MTLEGDVALVTGASRGIGRAIALRLARDGAAVAVNYLSDDRSAGAVAAEVEALGRAAVAVRADVRDDGAARELIDRVEAELGCPRIVVNNVGQFALGPAVETMPEAWRAILDSNLNSVFYVCRAALLHMRAQGGGRIVNIGLAPADTIRAAANLSAYAIAKAGVILLSRTLAAEEAPNGIRVNSVSPGLIDNGYLPPEQEAWMVKRVPMGRLGRPEEVADAVAFLVSPEASYVSGANLAVAGAWDWQDRPTSHDAEVHALFAPTRSS